MFDRIVHWWLLRRLRNVKRRVGCAYDADIAAAYKAKKPSEELASIRDTRRWELKNCDDEVAELETNYYLELAETYGVAAPPAFYQGNIPSNGWYKSDMFERLLLTTGGRAELRSAIRKEKRERREGWTTYISLLTGLLGVIVALVAVILRH